MRAASIDLEATRRVDVSVIGLHLLKAFEDASPVVRREAILALYLLVTDSTHFPYFVWVAHELTRHNLRLQQQQKHKEEGGREEVGGGGGGVNGEMAMSKSMESLASSEAASSSTSSMVGLMVEEDDEDEGGREERSVSLPLPNGNWNEKQKNKPAGEDAEGGEEGEEEWDRIPWYRGLSARLKKKGGEIAEHYLFLWLAIRQVHQKEPFPPAADVAGHLVHLVHERLLDMALDPSKTVPFPGPPAARPLRPTASAVILSPLQQQQQQQCLNQQQCQQQQLHQRQPRDLDAALSPPTRHSSSSSSSSSMAPPSTLHSSRVALRPFNSSGLPPRSPSSSTNLAAQAVQQQQPLPHQGGVGGPPSLPASPHPPPPPPSGVSRLPIERAVSAQELARPSQPHSHPSPSPQGLPRGGPAGSVPTAATTASVASTRNTLMPYGGTNHHQATHTNTSSSSSNNSSNSSSQGGRQGGMVSASGHRPTSTTGTSILQSAHGAPRNGLLSGALPGGGGGGMREKGSVFSSSSNAMNTNQTRVDRNPYVAISGGHPLARHQSLVAPDETTALGQASAARLMVSSFSTAAVADSPSVQWLRTQYHETNIYAWSKRHLSTPAALSPAAGEEGEEDPLSPEGQLNLYRKTRNRRVLQEAEALSLKCASVLGMPEEDENPDFLFMLDGIDALLSSQKAAGGGVGGKKWASTSSGGAAPKRKNQVLRLQQKAVFESDAEMTSQLLFHPFEPILVSSDDHSNVRVWNYEEGKKLGGFKNETAPNKASRVSSVTWLNEASSSLLLTGSEDGVVRVWDGVVPTGSRWTSPRLTTSFYVHALVGRGAGLVTKWVHGAGLLLTGGSSDQLRAWDLQREQMVREWETGGEACVTCLAATTPLQPPTGSTGGRGGIGGHSTPSSPLVVAGFGDGKAKIWDVRMDKCVGVLTEHQHWLVLTDFVKGDRELLTGSLTGEVKFWDLRRLKAPLRTVDVGKGPMTAMAAHHTCPLMASGSYNQFIKVLTLEGDTLSVIRYHDGILGQRIGPVATLTFHPCKLLLAAGAADSLISIYSAHFPQAS